MDQHSYDGSPWDCLSSTGQDPGTQYPIFGDSGLDGLWPDDWIMSLTNENLFVRSSSMAPQPSPSNGLNRDFAASPTSPKKSKSKGKQRKVDTGKVQTSPRREGLVEVQNTILTTAPIPPASSTSTIVEGATLNNENVYTNELSASASFSTLASGRVSKSYGATQFIEVAQSKRKTSPRKGASNISAPRPEATPDLSSGPIVNYSDDELEAILNHFKQNVVGFDTGPETVVEVPAESIAASATPEIPEDPVACSTEPISRKQKANEIVEDNIAGQFEPSPSALVSALASGRASTIHGATQPVQASQSKVKASPREGASQISAPQPEAIPDLSGNPNLNLSDEALEEILNQCTQNIEGFDTGPETVVEVSAEFIAALAIPEIPEDPVANPAEPISRKRKADEIVEDDIAGWFGDVDFSATVESSETEGLFENTEFTGLELPSVAGPSGDEESTNGTASFEVAEASCDTQSANDVDSERVDTAKTPEVEGGAEGAEASEENEPQGKKLQDMYCDFCDLQFTAQYAHTHYKRAAHNDNKIKYHFVHGFVHELVTGKMSGYHGSKDRAPTVNQSVDPELYKCGQPCAARRKLWEDHEMKMGKKRKAKVIVAELAQYHAPCPGITIPDITGLDPNLFLGQPISTLAGSAPPPPPRPTKARRTAKKSNPVGAEVRTPQLPHGPQPTWAPAYQHVPGQITQESTPVVAQEVHTPGQPQGQPQGSQPTWVPVYQHVSGHITRESTPMNAQVHAQGQPQGHPQGSQPTWVPMQQHIPDHPTNMSTPVGAQVHTQGQPQGPQLTWMPIHQHIPNRTTKMSNPVGAQARAPQRPQSSQPTWTPSYQQVPVPVATNNMGHSGEFNHQSYPVMNTSNGFAYGSHPGVQSQNQNFHNSGPVAGPSTHTRPAQPSANNGNAMRVPGPYMRHPQQQPMMYTQAMSMSQMNSPSIPNHAAPTAMGNVYHNTGAYAPVMQSSNMQQPPAAPTMRNPYHYVPQYAAAAPMMTQQTFNTEEYAIPSTSSTNQEYHETGGWQAAPF